MQRKLSNILKNSCKKYPESGKIIAASEVAVSEGAMIILIYVSQVKGTANAHSDADLLALFPPDIASIQIRRKMILAGRGFVNPVVAEYEGFLKGVKKADPFAYSIMNNCALIYAKDEKLFKRLEDEAAKAEDFYGITENEVGVFYERNPFV